MALGSARGSSAWQCCRRPTSGTSSPKDRSGKPVAPYTQTHSTALPRPPATRWPWGQPIAPTPSSAPSLRWLSRSRLRSGRQPSWGCSSGAGGGGSSRQRGPVCCCHCGSYCRSLPDRLPVTRLTRLVVRTRESEPELRASAARSTAPDRSTSTPPELDRPPQHGGALSPPAVRYVLAVHFGKLAPGGARKSERYGPLTVTKVSLGPRG
jgi:hypothetical protein